MQHILRSLLLFLALTPFCAAESDWREFVGPEMLGRLESADSIPATFFVSPEGNDDWSGRLPAPDAEKSDGPFRTLEKARDAVRTWRASADFDGKPTVVEIQPGTYSVDHALSLSGADSGTAASPVIWRGVRDAVGKPLAEILGGKAITGGKPVEDAAILARLQPNVRDKVLEYDLKALGIDDYGKLDGSNSAELFLNNQPMTIARYPNEGFMNFDDVVHEGNRDVDIRGTKGVAEPKLLLPDADLSHWAEEPEIWALGYWFWDWADSRQKIIRVDPETKLIELDKPYHPYGYRPGQYFYVYHALCELDSPGEYYIDNETGKLYFYPPEEITDRNLFLSMTPTFIDGSGLSHFTLSGLAFNGCRTKAVSLGGSDLLICGCQIRNTGGDGIYNRGDRNLLFGNHLYNIGSTGIDMNSGNRVSLTPGRTAIVNNDIHHFGRVNRMYTPAVGFGGCGDLVARNRFSNAPHSAIFFSGNDQRIEQNDISFVCEESNDAGAIYSGRDWTMRGNVIRRNYLHDIDGFEHKGCVGVYLDDMFSSADVVENLFLRVTRAAMIGGGRDNRVVNNIFIDCRPSFHVDKRALNWAGRQADYWINEFNEKGTISGIDIKSDLWAEKYPALAAIMDGNPKAPEGNLIERNLIIFTDGAADASLAYEGDALAAGTSPFFPMRDNVIGDTRLLFQTLRDENATLPGTGAEFRRIPVEEIGLFKGYGAVSR